MYITMIYMGKEILNMSFLNDNDFKSVNWKNSIMVSQTDFFVKKDFQKLKEYEKGFKIDELMF